MQLEMNTQRVFYALKSLTNVHFLFADALVRSDLVEQIPNVAIICHEAPHLFGDVLRNHLLDIVMKYLNDQDNQASESCLCRVLNNMYLKQKPKYFSGDVNIETFFSL